jgi:cyclopropane fatty-acyl-phospholipid synthase-like methyltransferase
VTACIVCGSQDSAPLYAGLLTRCRQCRYIWADVNMTAADVRALYGSRYFHGEEYGDYLADREAIERNAALRLATLERHIPPGAQRRLFEIGSAYGLFLNAARSRFDCVEGIDVTPEGVSYAKEQLGLKVRLGDLLTSDLTGPYDVVCAWDTIEHLQYPGAYLSRIASLMPAGGVLALTTGDIGSLNARFKGARWRLIHPPTHLHYFSLETMSRLLQRCGFDVVHQEHAGAYRSLGNMAHNIVALRWRLTRVGERLRRSRVGRLHVYVNLFDIMYVIARKR